MAAYFRTQVSGLYGGIRSYANRLPYFSRTTIPNANRPIESGVSNLHMTPESGMALKKPLLTLGISSIAGVSASYMASSAMTSEVMKVLFDNSSTIAGIAAGVGVLGVTSLALSIRHNMCLGRENRKLGSVDNNNKKLTSAINDVLLPMLSNDTPQSLAANIIALTGGRLSEDNKSVVDTLSQNVLPGMLATEKSGTELAKLLYTDFAVESPLEFIQALFKKSEGKWALTNNNLAMWQGERAGNLLAASRSMAQSCGKYDAAAFEKALALAEEAQHEQDSPEIQQTVAELRSKVVALNTVSDWTIKVPADKWHAVFVRIWNELHYPDEILSLAMHDEQKGQYDLSISATNSQGAMLTEILQEHKDITIEPFSEPVPEIIPEAPKPADKNGGLTGDI